MYPAYELCIAWLCVIIKRPHKIHSWVVAYDDVYKWITVYNIIMVVYIMNTVFYVCEKEMGVYRIRSCDLDANAWLLYDFCV